jgi:hypothetical protein
LANSIAADVFVVTSGAAACLAAGAAVTAATAVGVAAVVGRRVLAEESSFLFFTKQVSLLRFCSFRLRSLTGPLLPCAFTRRGQ